METSSTPTSETRRGPGWWMDLEGVWNPPELWPESTPPLDGWVRGDDGRWSPPTEVDTRGDGPLVIDLTTAGEPAVISAQSAVVDGELASDVEAVAHPQAPDEPPTLFVSALQGSASAADSTPDPAPALRLGFAEPAHGAVRSTYSDDNRRAAMLAFASAIAALITGLLVVLLVL